MPRPWRGSSPRPPDGGQIRLVQLAPRVPYREEARPGSDHGPGDLAAHVASLVDVDRETQRLPRHRADPGNLPDRVQETLWRVGGLDLDQPGVKRARDELLDLAAEDEPSRMDHGEAVAERLDLRHNVGGHDYRAALRGEVPEERPEVEGTCRVYPDHRLVEYQKGGGAQHRLGD